MLSDLRRWAPWAVVTLAVVLYLPILPNTFISDDWQQIFFNPFLKDPHGIKKIFSTNVWAFQGLNSNYYRPLMHLSFLLALKTFGFNPAGYHFLSLLMHGLVSLLVYLVIMRLSGDWRIGAVTGLLFAAHPIHTENVCWISDYVDLECAICVLFAWWLYLLPRSNRLASRWGIVIGIAACFFLGLLAKEIAIVLPLAMLAGSAGVPPAFSLKQLWHERKAEYIGLALSLCAYLALRIWGLGGLMPYGQAHALAPRDKFLTNVALFFRYWWKLLWPAELNMFPYFNVSRSPFEAPVLAGAAAIALFLWGAWRLWKAGRPEFAGLVLFLGALGPAFTLPYGDISMMAERYLYLPSIAFCWLLAWLIMRTGRRAPILLLAVLAAYGARTWARNLDWRSEIPFYEKSLRLSPLSADLHTLLGEAYMRRNMIPEAIAVTEQAVALRTRYPEAHNNLGQLYSRMGQPEKAIEQYAQAAQFAREKNYVFAATRAYTNMGFELRRLGRMEEAIHAYNEALLLQPDFAGARNNLGYLLLLTGRTQEAERQFERALQSDPTMAIARSNLGLLYAQRGELDRAAAHLSEALRMDPRDAETLARLGEVMLAKGDRARAEDLFRRALELQPDNERARAGLKPQPMKSLY